MARRIATLYIEYVYDSFDESLPDGFYNGKAMLYIMDSKSERLVLNLKEWEREMQDTLTCRIFTEQTIFWKKGFLRKFLSV